MLRQLVVLALLAVTTRCLQQQLVFNSDIFGHYVPSDNGTECPLGPAAQPVSLEPDSRPEPDSRQPDSRRSESLPLQTLQLESGEEEEPPPEDEDSMTSQREEEEEEEEEEFVTSRWGDCGVGGVPRLAGWVGAIRRENPGIPVVSGGNILGAGNWELPVNVSAAVTAASQFNVTGLGPGEFLRGALSLREFLTEINTATTSVVACNVQSSLLDGLLKPSVTVNGTLFIGVVDPDVTMQAGISFEPEIQLSNISCVEDEMDARADKKVPVVVVGWAASLNSSILNITGVSAFVLSGLSDQDKAGSPDIVAADGAPVLITKGYGETVGVFDITGGTVTNTTLLDSNVVEDNTTADSIAGLQQMVTDYYASPVMSYYNLTSERCNSTECSVGDVICDAALIGALLDGRVTSQPMAVWPGQNLTGLIPQGELSVSQLYSILPSDQVAIANASGDTVIQLFARAVEDMTKDASASATFLQVSGVRVTYDLDLDRPYRAKYLMNLCLTCSPQEYLPVTKSSNYTIVLPVFMLSHPSWADIVDQFTGLHYTGFSARDAVSAKAQVTGRLLAPVGNRIGFTHIPPDDEPTSDTFIAVLSTIVVCMVVFGLGLFGFHVWSKRQNQFGSTTGLLR